MKKLRVIAVGLILAAACLFYCFMLFIGMSGDGSTSGTALTFGDALLLFTLVPAAVGLGLLISATVYSVIDDVVTDVHEAIGRWMFDENQRGRELINWLVPQKHPYHTASFAPLSPSARRGYSVIHVEQDATAIRLTQALRSIWFSLDDENESIPDEYRTLIHAMMVNLRDGQLPGHGINVDEPWMGIPGFRVARLERWLRESPVPALAFITLLVDGASADKAWGIAEGV